MCHILLAFVRHFGLINIRQSQTFCSRDCVLAPTQTQHLIYKAQLHVYAKEESAITPSMAELIDTYMVSSFFLFIFKIYIILKVFQDAIGNIELSDNISYQSSFPPPLYDTFKPNYLKDAFEKEYHLGDLIFGQCAWTAYGRSPGKPNALS